MRRIKDIENYVCINGMFDALQAANDVDAITDDVRAAIRGGDLPGVLGRISLLVKITHALEHGAAAHAVRIAGPFLRRHPGHEELYGHTDDYASCLVGNLAFTRMAQAGRWAWVLGQLADGVPRWEVDGERAPKRWHASHKQGMKAPWLWDMETNVMLPHHRPIAAGFSRAMAHIAEEHARSSA